MKKEEIHKIVALGASTLVSIDPDTKTEISRRRIEGIIEVAPIVWTAPRGF